MAGGSESLLEQLAREYGVEIAYYDTAGRLRKAEPHSLLAVLRCLGAPLESLQDVPVALKERREGRWRRRLEPVTMALAGEPPTLMLRLREDEAEAPALCELELENGERESWSCRLVDLPVISRAAVEGVPYTTRQVLLPPLPPGYHRFALSFSSDRSESLVIAAPPQVFDLAPDGGKVWGVFLPLYALRSGRNWGAGDFSDLEALAGWVRELGGRLVGTLPLLPVFLEQPFDPSPYAPVSRLFWNEFYLDVTRVPELEQSPAARELLASPGFQEELRCLREGPLVDYRRGMALKRRILEHLARFLFSGSTRRRAELEGWTRACPEASDYARFRAVVERRKCGWPEWPQRLREGQLQDGDYDPAARRYHLYVQWLAQEQLGEVVRRARKAGMGIYLDFPLGVHRLGYDVWREREAFAVDADVGAPPDDFLPEGQNWGFPPLHPEGIREQGYRYFISCLRHHLRYAGFLRLDHVMALHRLFWIPKGLPAKEGVYVRYRAEEFYAILALETCRHGTVLVGEDLGTVSDEVRAAMERHRVYRMYVLPFQLNGSGGTPGEVPATALACLNTHDMVPFAAFWEGSSPERRQNLAGFLWRGGWMEKQGGETERALRACLKYLAASSARILLVNLEDLWLEKSPQNVPGLQGYPNWRRKAQYALEDVMGMEAVTSVLRELHRIREGGGR